MKVAITSSGKELTSLPDKRFGRCNCFVIYDTESDSVEVVDNPSRDYNEGAGPAAMQADRLERFRKDHYQTSGRQGSIGCETARD